MGARQRLRVLRSRGELPLRCGSVRICGPIASTVWYRIDTAPDGPLSFALRGAAGVAPVHANGKLDAVIGVLGRARSRLVGGSCRRTDTHGSATLAFTGVHTTTYFVIVGQQQGSKSGTFSLSALAAAPAEQFPGRSLPSHVVQATLNGLTNMNDVWHTNLTSGTTYRFAFSSSGCATAQLIRRTDRSVLLSIGCSGYRTFTPGPDGGGIYIFRVRAAPNDRAQPYRL